MSQPVSYGDLLRSFQGMRGLIVGDVMLDEYIFGKAARISPEAPVMVVHRQDFKAVPGGAANVVFNAAALGGDARIVGVVGDDSAGERLRESLAQGGIDPGGLVTDSGRPTTTKTRIIANHSHQVLRVDDESSRPISSQVEASLAEKIRSLVPDCRFVLFSDYAKGCLSPNLVSAAMDLARQNGVPTIANPKPGTASRYTGADVISLNRVEAAAMLGRAELGASEAEEAAAALKTELKAGAIILTLGGDGLAAAFESGTALVPAIRVEVYDEAGAGDTTIASLALCRGLGPLHRACLGLAVRTAAAVVKKVGVAVPTAEDLEFIGSTQVS